jgi:hypothetical protein
MKRSLTIAALATTLAVTVTPDAHAQMQWTDKGFFNVTFGGQAPSQTLSAETNPDIYGEPASIRSTQDVGGGFFFDFAGGYKVWRNLAVGIGFARVASSGDLNVDASIPDPLVFDNLRPATTVVPDASHSQTSINLTGTWMMPVTDKVDVGFQFGPTIFMVSQDLPADFQIQEPTPTITSTSLENVDKTTVGIHFGVDVTYLVTPRYGVGVLARYTWGSADLTGADDSVTVGGLQIGGGLRIRF